jgi:hypothetical protein
MGLAGFELLSSDEVALCRGVGITRVSRKVAQSDRFSAKCCSLGNELCERSAINDAGSPRCGDEELFAIKRAKVRETAPLGDALIHRDGLWVRWAAAAATAGAEEQIAPLQAS